jgi:hypothetical protein
MRPRPPEPSHKSRPNPIFFENARGNFRFIFGKIRHGTRSIAHGGGRETLRMVARSEYPRAVRSGPFVDEPRHAVRREWSRQAEAAARLSAGPASRLLEDERAPPRAARSAGRHGVTVKGENRRYRPGRGGPRGLPDPCGGVEAGTN